MPEGLLAQEQLSNAGAAIAQHRRRRGLTLSEVAGATGLSAAHISRVERGERAPSLGVLFQLSNAYAVSLGELVGEAGPSSGVHQRPEMDLVRMSKDVLYRPLSSTDTPGVQRIVLVDLPEGTSTPASTHAGSEWVYVVEGTLSLRVRASSLDLTVGDSYSFDAAQSHQLHCTSGPARFILVTSSPVDDVHDVAGH